MASHDEEGALVRDHLAARYGESSVNCGGASQPSFLCSGILLRGTTYSTAYHSWHPNPGSPKGDGVSFSFLRQDAKYNKLAYGYTHGFIVYPEVFRPGVTVELAILCSFPIDADSDARSEKGCGANAGYPTDSGPCQRQGIATAAQWLAHYWGGPPGNNPRQRQCSFTVAEGTANSAAMFTASLDAEKGLGVETFNVQNEIIIDSWKSAPDKVGVEAFFYATAAGLADGRSEQADFQKTVGAWRPLIKVNLPTTQAAQATFEYRPADQTP
jgi:hypothetical protein